jgi:phospho-N-acetylmuramoyl-pentapeptide-transferase
MIADIVKVFIPATISFLIGIAMTPSWSKFLYRHKMWKQKSGKLTIDGKDAEEFNKLRQNDCAMGANSDETKTPRMGGVVIWGSALSTVIIIWILSIIFPTDLMHKVAFFSRGQTWIPFSTLLLGAIVGLVDDYLEIRGNGSHIAGGLSLKKRLIIVGLVAISIALWFYVKLDISGIWFPSIGEFHLGWLFIPFFVLVVLAIYSGGVIDGIDGLAGGIFAIAYAAYGVIAVYQNQIDLAAFCLVVVGGILAFLWFNIPPARFYMSETGSMSLTITLAIIAFMTDTLGDGRGIIVLPIIAAPLIISSLSNIIQILSKKLRNGKKVFRIAPLHHHFEAIGWPSYKVTMRYWVISIIFGIAGIILALI